MSVYDRECVDRVRAALDRLYEASGPIIQVTQTLPAEASRATRGETRLGLAYRQELEAARAEALCALGDS